MSITKRILVIWIACIVLSFISLSLPHHYVDKVYWIYANIQILLFIMCLYIARKSSHQSKPIFVNISLVFFVGFLGFNNIFVGTALWKHSPYAVVYSHIFVNKIGLTFFLCVALLYLAVDYFFSKWKIVHKYLLTLSITVPIFAFLFQPYISDPLSLYSVDEYTRYLAVKNAHTALESQTGIEPTASAVQQALVGETGMHITLSEIVNLKNYLTEGAETILFWKPLNVKLIYVNIFLVALLLVFVFHKYWNDKPHPAYLEKIAILFILWCTFDAFHYWAFIHSASLEIYRTLFTISQYLNILTVLLMVYVFSVRLRFVLSPSGQFYEEELLLHPERITRWRDEIDTLVLNTFFTSKKLFGRLITFTPSRGVSGAEQN